MSGPVHGTTENEFALSISHMAKRAWATTDRRKQ